MCPVFVAFRANELSNASSRANNILFVQRTRRKTKRYSQTCARLINYHAFAMRDLARRGRALLFALRKRMDIYIYIFRDVSIYSYKNNNLGLYS